jgi:hypothetical protein
MPIAFSAVGTGSAVASGNGSPVMPATVNPFDIAILVWSSDDAVTASLPAGWNIVHQANSSFMHGGWAWKRCDGSEDGATVTLTHAAGGACGSCICTFSGVRRWGEPFSGTSVSLNATGDSSIEVASITPVATDTTIIVMGAVDDIGGATAPTGTNPTFTERMDFAGTGSLFGNVSLHSGTSDGAAMGARTITSSGSGPSIGWAAALIPEPVGVLLR